MIDYVSGKLVSKKPTEAVVDVGGVGYRVEIPTSTFEDLPDVGQPVRILTYHHVREDAQLLFGFMGVEERSVFELMLNVSGIGPKLALAALSAMRPGELRDAVLNDDSGMLTRIPGVGRKTAERMVIELRDRFDDLRLGASAGTVGAAAPDFKSDALAALEALGLSRKAADRAVRAVLEDDADVATAEDLIRLALRK
ncbi:MAG: Holliday junction branch migration protein RuvA [Rhodothermales bacterium]|nr:Holliday junction branch migration protein RuvA [Rhodothermales bacterium]